MSRPLNWPAFWRGFGDGLATAGAVVCIIAIILAVLAWQFVLPTVGLLWFVGWLA